MMSPEQPHATPKEWRRLRGLHATETTGTANSTQGPAERAIELRGRYTGGPSGPSHGKSHSRGAARVCSNRLLACATFTPMHTLRSSLHDSRDVGSTSFGPCYRRVTSSIEEKALRFGICSSRNSPRVQYTL
jgi:hypothetical protein